MYGREKINNDHYVGQTITGQDAFWSEDLPGNVAYLFSRSRGVMIYDEPRYWAGRRGFALVIEGALRFNPILKNVDDVVLIEGMDKILISKSAAKPRAITAEVDEVFVNLDRLEELRNIHSDRFDLQKLIRLCEELNINFANQCYLAVTMLTRSILNHVPPIFDKKDFREIVSHYDGRSFKAVMRHLEESSRKIADAHLHLQIRDKETLPNKTQVDFRQSLDKLLEEVVRILK